MKGMKLRVLGVVVNLVYVKYIEVVFIFMVFFEVYFVL